MCISGGHQCKTIPIPGFHVSGHPKQTWTFPLNDIAIEVPKCTKYKINVYEFFRFLIYILSFPSILCADKRHWGYKLFWPKHGSSPQRIAIKDCKWTKIYEIKSLDLLQIWDMFLKFNFCFQYRCWQVKWQFCNLIRYFSKMLSITGHRAYRPIPI